MPLAGFIDDSGSEPSSPVFVLGGMIIPVEIADNLRANWRTVLAHQPAIPMLKASDIRKRDDSTVAPEKRGAFYGLSGEQRERKIDALIDVVATYRFVMFSARMQWAEFAAFRNMRGLEDVADSPYFFLLQSLIARLATLSHDRGYPGRTKFVFDDQNKLSRRIKGWFPSFYDRLDDLGKKYIDPTPEWSTDLAEPLLQIGDLFAWLHRRVVLGSVTDDWEWRCWTVLSRNLSTHVVECGNMESAASDMGVYK